MEILKAHIEDDTKTVLKMEKSSLMDYMQKVPAQSMGKMPIPKTPKEAEGQIEQLNKLEEEIEKEKSEIQKQVEVQAKDKKTLKSQEKKQKKIAK